MEGKTKGTEERVKISGTKCNPGGSFRFDSMRRTIPID